MIGRAQIAAEHRVDLAEQPVRGDAVDQRRQGFRRAPARRRAAHDPAARPSIVVGSCSTRTPSRSMANAATELPTRAPATWLWIDRIVFTRLRPSPARSDGRPRRMPEQAMTARPRRSCLYMPGANPKALEKAKTLAADVLLLDLEDSVAPEAKETPARKSPPR